MCEQVAQPIEQRRAGRRRSRSPPSGTGPTAGCWRGTACAATARRSDRDRARAPARPAIAIEMDDRVGRSAERHRRRDRVLERRGRQDVARPQVLPHHLDDAAAGGRRPCADAPNRPPESTRRPAASGPAHRPPPPSSTPCPSSCRCRTSGRCRLPSRATRTRRACRRAARPSTSRRRCPSRGSARASCRAASARPGRRSPAGWRSSRPSPAPGTVLSQPPSRTTPSAG